MTQLEKMKMNVLNCILELRTLIINCTLEDDIIDFGTKKLFYIPQYPWSNIVLFKKKYKQYHLFSSFKYSYSCHNLLDNEMTLVRTLYDHP